MSKLILTTSWDDGSKFDLKLADLLNKYGIEGTFYIPKSYRSDPLSKEEIKMLDSKFEVGAHTLNHIDLTAVSLEEGSVEIEGSKLYLEGLLGHSVRMFCYPKGRYNENVKGMVKRSGFIAARTCDYGTSSPVLDPYGWQTTLQTSNGSPRITLITWWMSGVSIRSLLDWEIRAKLLFDLALNNGGIYHIWGHSWEIEKGKCWDKLEKVFSYISGKKEKDVGYLTNGDIFQENNHFYNQGE